MWGEEPQPVSLYANHHKESFDLRDREFGLIDRVFGYLPSQLIEYKINHAIELPITILDVGGGGFSVSARNIAERYGPTVRVINVDVALHSSVKDTPNFQARLEDACSLTIPDDSVDFAYTYQVIHCLSPARKHMAIREIARVLKPGGIALIDEDRYCILPPEDAQLHDLAKNLATQIYLRTGNVRKTLGSPSIGFKETDKFLMIAKPPVDPRVLEIKEKTEE